MPLRSLGVADLERVLQRAASDLGARPRAVNRDILMMILPLYDGSTRRAIAAVRRSLAIRRPELTRLYTAYRADTRPDVVSDAPEGLLVLERLVNDPDRLVHLWRRHAPIADLEAIATFYGQSL